MYQRMIQGYNCQNVSYDGFWQARRAHTAGDQALQLPPPSTKKTPHNSKIFEIGQITGTFWGDMKLIYEHNLSSLLSAYDITTKIALF